MRVSTLRQYLEVLGARLELVAVFDDEDPRDRWAFFPLEDVGGHPVLRVPQPVAG